jgi:serine/threonine protein kinase
MVDSKYVSGDLVTYLSQRAAARGGEVVECAPNLPLVDWIGTSTWKAIIFNESVAIKVFKTGVKSESLAKSEASVMAKLDHPGIVPLVGVSSLPNHGPCLIMELMSGDLRDLIRSRPRFSLHVSVDIILQIAEAMRHIHNAGLVHQFLHPLNILFKVVEDEQLFSARFVVVKVAGFGRATESKEGELSMNLEHVGNFYYMAPEVPVPGVKIKSVRMRNSNVVDVYSFGLVCYNILSGKEPIIITRSSLTMTYARARADVQLRLPATCPPMLAPLIQRCLASDPNSRPDFERICWELRHIKTMLITGSSSSMNFQ